MEIEDCLVREARRMDPDYRVVDIKARDGAGGRPWEEEEGREVKGDPAKGLSRF